MDVNLLISEFKSKWLDKAKDYAQNPMRIQQLIPEIKNYVTKVRRWLLLNALKKFTDLY